MERHGRLWGGGVIYLCLDLAKIVMSSFHFVVLQNMILLDCDNLFTDHKLKTLTIIEMIVSQVPGKKLILKVQPVKTKVCFVESLTAQNNFVKPWESGSSSTLDISALTSQDQDQPQDQALDSLESQMAALHGAAGANTPWHSFQSDYY